VDQVGLGDATAQSNRAGRSARDCEKECRKHADTRVIGKACANSCARFIAESKRLSTA